MAARAGDSEAAERALRELIGLAPDFPRALGTLARLLFRGPSYREVLAFLHQRLQPRSYLEIGVEFGLTLRLAERAERAVGVDPNPRPRHKLAPNTRVFAETSDDFFSRHERQDIFGEERVDFAFVDGMHCFEYVLRDFAHVERWCKPGSTVVLHDCLPVAPISAERERKTQFWVGDTWKALECLLEVRPDLTIQLIPCYPSGLVLIQHLDPQSRVLAEQLPTLQEKYMTAAYPHVFGAWPAHYRLLDNSFVAIDAALAVRGAGAPSGSSRA
jgi:predicted O-methyltransferase YrrM